MYVYIESVILTNMLLLINLKKRYSRVQCEFYWCEVVFGIWIIIDIFNGIYSMVK